MVFLIAIRRSFLRETRFWVLFLGVLMAGKVGAQELNDTTALEIVYTDLLSRSNDITSLVGRVHVRQGNNDFQSKRARIYPNKVLQSGGGITITQPPNVTIRSDSLNYEGSSRFSKLFRNVQLSDGKASLFTNSLDYDFNTKVGRYLNFGQVVTDSANLSSQRGYYYGATGMTHYHGNVKMRHPRLSLNADTLSYNLNTEIAYFHGPTHIKNEDKRLYCEGGYYDTKKKYAVFEKKAQYFSKKDTARADKIIYDGANETYTLEGHAFFVDSTGRRVYSDKIIYDLRTKAYKFEGNTNVIEKNSKRRMKADNTNFDEVSGLIQLRGRVSVVDTAQSIVANSLDYNKNTKWGEAKGQVVYRDSLNKLTVTGGYLRFNDSTGYVLAAERPVFYTKMDNDSLWLRADTINSFKPNPKDSARILKAYKHTYFFKEGLYGRCDSLYFSTLDSAFRMYQKPMVWADSSQFKADTLFMFMKSKKVHKIDLLHNSFIQNTPDSLYYNQIKGNNTHAFFKDGKVNLMHVISEGESVYYIRNAEGAYSGVNKTLCQNMRMHFKNGQVQKVFFFKDPKAVLYPMKQVNHKTLQLEGFKIITENIPKNKFFIIRYK